MSKRSKETNIKGGERLVLDFKSVLCLVFEVDFDIKYFWAYHPYHFLVTYFYSSNIFFIITIKNHIFFSISCVSRQTQVYKQLDRYKRET